VFVLALSAACPNRKHQNMRSVLDHHGRNNNNILIRKIINYSILYTVQYLYAFYQILAHLDLVILLAPVAAGHTMTTPLKGVTPLHR
jgi:hypothetical protein